MTPGRRAATVEARTAAHGRPTQGLEPRRPREPGQGSVPRKAPLQGLRVLGCLCPVSTRRLSTGYGVRHREGALQDGGHSCSEGPATEACGPGTRAGEVWVGRPSRTARGLPGETEPLASNDGDGHCTGPKPLPRSPQVCDARPGGCPVHSRPESASGRKPGLDGAGLKGQRKSVHPAQCRSLAGHYEPLALTVGWGVLAPPGSTRGSGGPGRVAGSRRSAVSSAGCGQVGRGHPWEEGRRWPRVWLCPTALVKTPVLQEKQGTCPGGAFALALALNLGAGVRVSQGRAHLEAEAVGSEPESAGSFPMSAGPAGCQGGLVAPVAVPVPPAVPRSPWAQ